MIKIIFLLLVIFGFSKCIDPYKDKTVVMQKLAQLENDIRYNKPPDYNLFRSPGQFYLQYAREYFRIGQAGYRKEVIKSLTKLVKEAKFSPYGMYDTVLILRGIAIAYHFGGGPEIENAYINKVREVLKTGTWELKRYCSVNFSEFWIDPEAIKLTGLPCPKLIEFVLFEYMPYMREIDIHFEVPSLIRYCIMKDRNYPWYMRLTKEQKKSLKFWQKWWKEKGSKIPEHYPEGFMRKEPS